MHLLSYILAGLWFLFILRWDVYSDYAKWASKPQIPVKHTKEAFVRAVYLLPSYILLYWPKVHKSDRFWEYLCYVAIVCGVLFSVWWEFFDGWYNTKRGFKWRFNGSHDPDDSKLDQFLYHIGDTWEGILKWGLIITFITSYVLIK